MSEPIEQPEPNRLRRVFQRLPAPIKWVLQIVIGVVALIAISAAFEGATRLSENVLFPRHIDPAWATQVDLPLSPGDSWIGNLTTDGERIYFGARQTIGGFWGQFDLWSSADGGLTWSSPVSLVSRHAIPDAARHTLAVAPDGTLWAAFAERGPEVATQRLLIRTSADQGTTWSEAIAASPARVGLIGLPVLLLTNDVHLVAFTDGETGDVLVQRLTMAGAAVGEPVTLGRTTRQLYFNTDFHDAAIALASAQGRIVAVWVEGAEELRAAVSTDGGESWEPATGLDQSLYSARPRLASNGIEILLAASDPSRGAMYVRHPFIRIWQSLDGGATFERGPDVSDVEDLGWLDLLWADERWRLVYNACPGFFTCATPERIWYAESADGMSWTDAVVLSEAGPVRAVGLVSSRFGLSAIWGEGLGSHEWTFHLARRSP